MTRLAVTTDTSPRIPLPRPVRVPAHFGAQIQRIGETIAATLEVGRKAANARTMIGLQTDWAQSMAQAEMAVLELDPQDRPKAFAEAMAPMQKRIGEIKDGQLRDQAFNRYRVDLGRGLIRVQHGSFIAEAELGNAERLRAADQLIVDGEAGRLSVAEMVEKNDANVDALIGTSLSADEAEQAKSGFTARAIRSTYGTIIRGDMTPKDKRAAIEDLLSSATAIAALPADERTGKLRQLDAHERSQVTTWLTESGALSQVGDLTGIERIHDQIHEMPDSDMKRSALAQVGVDRDRAVTSVVNPARVLANAFASGKRLDPDEAPSNAARDDFYVNARDAEIPLADLAVFFADVGFTPKLIADVKAMFSHESGQISQMPEGIAIYNKVASINQQAADALISASSIRDIAATAVRVTSGVSDAEAQRRVGLLSRADAPTQIKNATLAITGTPSTRSTINPEGDAKDSFKAKDLLLPEVARKDWKAEAIIRFLDQRFTFQNSADSMDVMETASKQAADSLLDRYNLFEVPNLPGGHNETLVPQWLTVSKKLERDFHDFANQKEFDEWFKFPRAVANPMLSQNINDLYYIPIVDKGGIDAFYVWDPVGQAGKGLTEGEPGFQLARDQAIGLADANQRDSFYWAPSSADSGFSYFRDLGDQKALRLLNQVRSELGPQLEGLDPDAAWEVIKDKARRVVQERGYLDFEDPSSGEQP